MMNKERFFAEQNSIGRGFVQGMRKHSETLKVISKVRNKFNNLTTLEIHDNIVAKYICKHYID